MILVEEGPGVGHLAVRAEVEAAIRVETIEGSKVPKKIQRRQVSIRRDTISSWQSSKTKKTGPLETKFL